MNQENYVRTSQLVMHTLAFVVTAILVLVMAFPVQAEGEEVTMGQFYTFASGPGLNYNVTGHAVMTRTGDGKTIVVVHATGLLANTAYGVHVHNQPCGVSNGGGHYQNEVGGAPDAVNEIWPLFTTNSAGIGNGFAKNDFLARPEAQSVVIHAPGGARIACADLQ